LEEIMKIYFRLYEYWVLCLQTQKHETYAMPTRAAAPSSAPARRHRSVLVRRKARNAKADRERQIVGLLNRGLSVAEIASQSGVSIEHMRNLVRKILAERMPQPPAEYLALQVSRLNEALLVSYSAMHNSATGANFEAVDRVVRIVRELDRYHGFAAIPRRREESEPLCLPPPPRARSRSSLRSARGSKLAPQVIENARFGLANGRSVRSVIIADVRVRKRFSRAAVRASLFPVGRRATRHHSKRDRQEERGE
jgi:DNA-binding CsgD family transcriptional regulator